MTYWLDTGRRAIFESLEELCDKIDDGCLELTRLRGSVSSSNARGAAMHIVPALFTAP